MIVFGRFAALIATSCNRLGLLAQSSPRSLTILIDGQLIRKVNLAYSIRRHGYLTSSLCGMKKFFAVQVPRQYTYAVEVYSLSENIAQVENSLGLVKRNESAQFWVMAPAISDYDSKLYIFTVSHGQAEDWIHAAKWLSESRRVERPLQKEKRHQIPI